MHAIRWFKHVYCNGVRTRRQVVGAVSLVIVAAAAAFPSSASASESTPRAVSAASATSLAPDALCTSPPNNGVFDYCNHSSWVGIACSTNVNHNGTNGVFNVYYVQNGCFMRVWLHEYADWSAGGWSYCISPQAYDTAVPAAYQHPLNIYVSSNPDAC